MIIRVLLVDDHQIVREGLRCLIEKQSDMEVVGETGDGRSAVELVDSLLPHVVVMDVSMPGLNGIDATCQITRKHPEVKVIGLSIHSSRHFISEMLKAGASGYLLKSCAFDEMTHAIQEVTRDHIYLSPRLADTIVDDYVKRLAVDVAPSCSRLSNREREVLQLISEGKSTKEIASCLHISVKTIATHREHIMDKVNVNNVVELTKYAVREGLTSFEL
jgi:DNA-binding NarL/FixJ family response regulator